MKTARDNETKRKLVALTIAILESLTLVEGAPETALSLPVLENGIMDLAEFTAFLRFLQDKRLILIRNHYVTLEMRGRTLLENQLIKEAQRKAVH
jgi:hypothetical protein